MDETLTAPAEEFRGPLETDRPAYIAGIGASAGGLEALERLFEGMPATTGIAFVVVQHLSPDFKSLTDELLARRTTIPIYRVENGMEVRPNAIFLIPPKKDMIVANGRLLLTDKDPGQFVALPIDHFFRSLAQEARESAIGIVLSGTGSDGSRGIRAIHEAGGLVLVQSIESSKFDGMPRSALETGVVDLALPPEGMPDALMRFVKHPLARALPVEEPVGGMEAIFRLLRDAYNIDFSHYKPDTVARRTERRILLNRSVTLDEYADRLAHDPEELNLLYKDLLIGVTRFFRDQEAFARLHNDLLRDLINRLGPDEELRIWSCACSAGEEAYSLAMLALECRENVGRNVPVRVFATDVHRASLDLAGQGVYPEEALAEITPDRRERFFVRRADGYQVTPELRKTVVFAQHNVLRDAPFTRMDLISCRNLLIYFQPEAQKKALSLFHFALKTGCVLLLGPSESPGELADEFEILDARWKLYRKRRDARVIPELRLTPAGVSRGRGLGLPGGPGPAALPDVGLLSAYDALLDEFMPPGLLVNEHREVVQAFGGAGKLLKLPDGRFSADVLDMVEPDLRMALAGALPRAFKDMTSVVCRGLRVRGSGSDERLVDVTVRLVRGRRVTSVFALVHFDERGSVAPSPEAASELDIGQASREQVKDLESELRYTKENLQAMVEEMETANEELQATNEELLASNEELQSTNEELHSVNEELYTVNAEYQKKIAELTEVTADMDNLLVSTDVHTVFLDRNLCIRKFTPRIAETFNLMPQDIGRRIDNFSWTLEHPDLLDDLRRVLETYQPVERQLRDRRGRWFLMRVLPYRSGTSVGGVVLTLIDVDRLKQAEADSRRSEQQLAGILANSPNWLFIRDERGRYTLADEAFRRAVGVDPIGRTPHDLFAPAVAELLTARHNHVLKNGVPDETEVVLPLADGPHTFLSFNFPMFDEEGKVVSVGGIKTDVTQLKRAESQAREAVVQRDRFLAMLSHELRNPLAAVLNAVRVLGALGPNAPGAADWFRVVERRSRHMGRLLDDLLDVSRLTHNKIEIRKEVFDLGRITSEVIEEVRPWYDERRLQLTVVSPDAPVVVEGDPSRLLQMQVNLLMNAAKYTPQGGRVRFAMGREGNEAVVRVKDTGVGLDQDMLERVFDPFVQANSTLDRSEGGIGVGLTLVRSIVELHGGTVRAFSDGAEAGSEFVVRLPLAVSPLPPRALEYKPATVGPLRLLIVEDDTDIRESLRQLLELEGHRVRTADTGTSGLAEFDLELPDAALVDIGIPDVNGYELARRVRQRWPAAAVTLIALTGYGQPGDQAAARAAGFDAHLTKPFKPEELGRLLERTRLRP